MNSTLLRFLAVFLAIGAIATAIIGYRLSTRPAPIATPLVPAGFPQVVAAHDLTPGRLLTAQDVRLEMLPQRDPHGYDSAAKVIGKWPLETIKAGSPLLAEHFPRLSPVAQTLHPGERGVAIKVSEVVGVGGFLAPGDHVDVLLYLRGSKETNDISSAQVVLRDVRVLAYGEDTIATDTQPAIARITGADGKADETRKKPPEKDKSGRSAILAVPEQEAARLMLADSSGQLRLALRGAEMPGAMAAVHADKPTHYLKLVELTPTGAAVPSSGVTTAVAGKPAAAKAMARAHRKSSPPEENTARVIVHRGDQVEVVSVKN
jgi:pilus assembly protein CpaB